MLTITGPNGERQYQFFDGVEAPFSLDMQVINAPGFPNPLVAVVGGSAGGSDISFETAPFALESSGPREVGPRISTTIQDGICLGTFGGQPGLLLVEFRWEYEAHYHPHRYTTTVYEVEDGSYVKQARTRTTKRKYASWQAAARSLGYRCRANLVLEVVGAERLSANPPAPSN